jgi:hypothetical protein
MGHLLMSYPTDLQVCIEFISKDSFAKSAHLASKLLIKASFKNPKTLSTLTFVKKNLS